MDILLPKNNLLPELNCLLDITLNFVFRQAGPSEKTARGLCLNFTRIVAHTIFEYNFANKVHGRICENILVLLNKMHYKVCI
jgi:hypothetical protein